jgi:hypothetical protein
MGWVLARDDLDGKDAPEMYSRFSGTWHERRTSPFAKAVTRRKTKPHFLNLCNLWLKNSLNLTALDAGSARCGSHVGCKENGRAADFRDPARIQNAAGPAGTRPKSPGAPGYLHGVPF